MTEEDIKSIREGVEALRRRPISVNRAGLYIMVFIAMINSCDMKSTIRNEVRNLNPEEQYRNVIGNEKEDRFYDLAGKRAYLEIDGRPVEEYLRK